jgi:hypothetical protein
MPFVKSGAASTVYPKLIKGFPALFKNRSSGEIIFCPFRAMGFFL